MYHSFSEGLRIASEGCSRHWSATLSFSKSSLHSSGCLPVRLTAVSSRSVEEAAEAAPCCVNISFWRFRHAVEIKDMTVEELRNECNAVSKRSW